MKDKITLAKDTIANDDIDSLREWLATYPHLTKGPLTLQFEKEFSNYIGTKHAIFVNSGSSAILLVLQGLVESKKLMAGDFVLLPALSWSTDFSPILQLGLQPLLVDANPHDLSIDIEKARQLCMQFSPKALLLVSVLGLVPNMKEIQDLCSEFNVILLEDSCESLGSEFMNKKLGSFGFASMFSTYFGHHISTIEGGVICTDDDEFANLLKCIRSHGWTRDADKNFQQSLKKENNISDFEELYTFYFKGFNFRATDLQAYIGINQLKKLSHYVQNRNSNFKAMIQKIDDRFWKPKQDNHSFCSNFAYPMISDKRNLLVQKFAETNIEVRPLIAGSIARQPFYKNSDIKFRADCPFADIIHEQGLYLPNHALLTGEEIDRICNAANSVL